MALWRVHVELADRPGRLGTLATAVGEAGGNIVSLHVVGEPAGDGSVVDELLVEIPAAVDPDRLAAALADAGIPASLLVSAGAIELADPVTTALALARMVAADPGSAPGAVATLLRARLADPDAAAAPHVRTLRVGARQVRLTRAWPFSATELSRAAGLLELAAQLRAAGPAGGPEHRRVLLADGTEVLLRRATSFDAPLVATLHARSSPASRRARLLPPARALDPVTLLELVGGGSGRTVALLALTEDGGSAVGLLDLVPDGVAGARLGVLVDDAWQGRGLGTALVRMGVGLAVEHGAAEVVGSALPGDLRITRLLRRAGLRPSGRLRDGMLEVRAGLPVVAAAR